MNTLEKEFKELKIKWQKEVGDYLDSTEVKPFDMRYQKRLDEINEKYRQEVKKIKKEYFQKKVK
ncbi:MAG: hypothetical protein K6G64_09495 [Eubacterium sp.]|nr:hypothetical protein [Eubacterium sp.]